MAGALPHACSKCVLYTSLVSYLAVDKVADVLLDRESYHDTQAVFVGNVEQRPGRRRVRNSNRVHAVGRDLCEIRLYLVQVAIFVSLSIRFESAIGHTADLQLCRPREDELSADSRSGVIIDKGAACTLFTVSHGRRFFERVADTIQHGSAGEWFPHSDHITLWDGLVRLRLSVIMGDIFAGVFLISCC